MRIFRLQDAMKKIDACFVTLLELREIFEAELVQVEKAKNQEGTS
jgi:hypothetical protein